MIKTSRITQLHWSIGEISKKKTIVCGIREMKQYNFVLVKLSVLETNHLLHWEATQSANTCSVYTTKHVIMLQTSVRVVDNSA
jgi:hypothetical protein